MLIRSAFGIFLISWLLALLTLGGHLYSPDEEIMFRVTESIATRARLDVPPIVGPDGKTFATRKGVNGREYAQYGVGNSLFAVPFYWMGAAVCQVVPDATAQRLLDFNTQGYVEQQGPGRGHALLKRLFVSLSGGVIMALTAMLVSRFCMRLSAPRDGASEGRYSPAACGITALAYAAATMALPHARTFFSEPLAGLCLLWSIYLLATPAALALTWRRAAFAGTALALGFFTRLDTLFACPGVGVLLLWRLPAQSLQNELTGLRRLVAELRQRLTPGNLITIAAFCAPCLAFLAWQLVMNALHFGSPFSSAYADQPEGINFSTPVLAGLYGFLFSVGKSLFLFSPAILLGLMGWGRFTHQHKALGISLAIAILCKLAVHSTWQNWAGGWCWGPRHVFIIHAMLVLPAVAFISGGGAARRLFVDATLLAGFIVQMYGSSQNFIDYYTMFYRTPYTQPQATVLYGPEDLAAAYITATAVGPEGNTVPFPVQAMPAPITDSIYVPQNSQWYRYAEMWNAGYTDNFWLRLLQRTRGKEQPIQ